MSENMTSEEQKYFEKVQRGKKVRKKKDGSYNDREKRILEEALDARSRIFFMHADLIDKVYYAYFARTQKIPDDVRQNSAEAILASIKTFDPEKGVKFSTYASTAIKRAIIKTVAGQSLLSVKSGFLKNCYLLESASYEFQKEHGRLPTQNDLVDMLPFGRRAVRNVLYRRRSLVHMCDINSPEGEDDDFSLSICSKQAEGLDDPVLDEVTELQPGGLLYCEISEQLSNILNTYCTIEEQMVLDYRFGFHGDPISDEEIAIKLGITEEEVKRIWGLALLKLEEPCKEYEMKDAL